MAKAYKLLVYVALFALIALGVTIAVHYKVKNEIQSLEFLQRELKGVYEALSFSIDSILSKVSEKVENDTLRAVIASQRSVISNYDKAYEQALSRRDFQAVVYIMNKKSSAFFQLINFCWDNVPEVKNDTTFLKTVGNLTEKELKIDSLAQVAQQKVEFLKKLENIMLF